MLPSEDDAQADAGDQYVCGTASGGLRKSKKRWCWQPRGFARYLKGTVFDAHGSNVSLCLIGLLQKQ